MTYKELYQKSWAHFDPEGTGCIKGYPVMVLLNISYVADEDGWDKQIIVTRFREHLIEKKSLNKNCVSAVLEILTEAERRSKR